MPLVRATGLSRIGQTSCTWSGPVRSSRVVRVTPLARQVASPPTHTGRRGSAAVAKLTPFVPSEFPTLYRQDRLFRFQTWLLLVVWEWSMVYTKFVGTPVTDVAASAGRFRFSRIRPRRTLSAFRTRLSSFVV